MLKELVCLIKKKILVDSLVHKIVKTQGLQASNQIKEVVYSENNQMDSLYLEKVVFLIQNLVRRHKAITSSAQPRLPSKEVLYLLKLKKHLLKQIHQELWALDKHK